MSGAAALRELDRRADLLVVADLIEYQVRFRVRDDRKQLDYGGHRGIAEESSRFGIATLEVNSAGPDLQIEGLATDTAERLKALVVERAGDLVEDT